MDLLELGRVGKAHGLKGQLILSLTTDRTVERLAPGSVLFLGPAAETAKPYVVGTAQPHQSKWLVSLVGLETRNNAESLRGHGIYGEPLSAEQLADDDVLFVHELIGKRVVDQHGVDHGPVLSVIDNPASDLLELEGDRLVPLAFYSSHDEKVILVEVPVGLLDDQADEAG